VGAGVLATVDVWLPICDEPREVLLNTWKHIAALQWPGMLTVTVLDDGGDPEVAALAKGFGFTYLCRPNRGWMKKSGNLQFAYQQTSGAFVSIFDADFCPRPDFLLELMPYFDDPALGIVQSPQYFTSVSVPGVSQTGNSYTVTTASTSGDTYSITRTASGLLLRTCADAAGRTACVGGTW
jgi:cellulose synthase/poly-beta-1,6-N-acetylglucosamine synthase-like glycosyltransferase